jgi:hypothetical protein
MRSAMFAFVALLAGAAQAQNLQLACKVQWERQCNNALMDFRECPPELRAETNEGTIEIAGNKAHTKKLGPVTEYVVTKRSANEFQLEGRVQDMRGWGVLDNATGKLRLVFTLGDLSPIFLQRGLEGECRQAR